jgi:protein-disulfide isomerase
MEYTSEFSANIEDQIQRMRGIYPDMKLSYRVYPIDNQCNPRVAKSINKFPMACRAALAAKAAFITGGADGAWRFHQWLLENGPQVSGDQDLLAGAIAIGVDPAVFMDAIDSPEASAMVAEDVELGAVMRFRGPPALFVNGRHVSRFQLEGYDILGAVFKAAHEGN